MRKILIAGNWKMNLGIHEASLLVERLESSIKTERGVEVVLAPTLLCLQPISQQINHRKFKLAAQNAYFMDEGAYTGEVSFAMLRGLADYVIVGHSERRIYFHEDDELIRDKVAAAVRNGITPILCIGENLKEREGGETRAVVYSQLSTAISNLTAEEIEKMVIAYEPVWAISTFGGIHAKPDDIEKVLVFIRSQIEELYGKASAEAVMVIYGGSVDQHNVRSYLELPGCDGALPGGASLVDHKFAAIVAAASRLQNERAKSGK